MTKLNWSWLYQSIHDKKTGIHWGIAIATSPLHGLHQLQMLANTKHKPVWAMLSHSAPYWRWTRVHLSDLRLSLPFGGKPEAVRLSVGCRRLVAPFSWTSWTRFSTVACLQIENSKFDVVTWTYTHRLSIGVCQLMAAQKFFKVKDKHDQPASLPVPRRPR